MSLSPMSVGEEVSRSFPNAVSTTYSSRFIGKTLCLGTRLAKLELRLITAMFVLGFRHGVVDKTGKTANQAPIPNWNDILLARPQNNSCNVKYERSGLLL
jgi:hypothetical protein